MRKYFTTSIQYSGFSLLHLLFVIVIIALVLLLSARQIMKYYSDERSILAFDQIERELIKEIRGRSELNILEADNDIFMFRDKGVEKGFRVTGESPFKSFEKFYDGEWDIIAENIIDLSFIYLDEYGNSLYEDEARERSELICKIIVKAKAHTGKEVIDHFVNNGIDLDGNPSNGLAKQETTEIFIEMR